MYSSMFTKELAKCSSVQFSSCAVNKPLGALTDNFFEQRTAAEAASYLAAAVIGRRQRRRRRRRLGGVA